MANSARLDAALAAASEASRLVRAHYEGARSARAKADGTPVTDADVAAEQAIRAVVQARFPEDGFYGEETAAERSACPPRPSTARWPGPNAAPARFSAMQPFP
jgi:histidinol-phosphatase